MWVAEWNEIVFTDESRICLQHHDGRIRVWRHRGKRMLNSCVMHRHTGPAPSIMVWGSIGCPCLTPLVRIADLEVAEMEHAYLNIRTRGNLSSLIWIDSPLKYSKDSLLCHVYYASLNFRDIMMATGKLSQTKPVILKSLGWNILLHPLYSPDIAPSEYHLFASMENALAEQHFSYFEEVRKWLDKWFASKDKQFFWHGIHKLLERWAKCVDADCQYFE
ncbi:mariner Mos1 transposase [Trichonephila clavipes]|nr:mariner Mos1 transposase [Trichonephila clavipes]